MGVQLIKIEEFTGPLDLLDHIIQSRRADLSNLPISEICDQYMEHLEAVEEENEQMDFASEFVLMGATLLQIKTAMLLPRRENAEEEEDDPRDELVLKLMAYRRVKALAESLEEKLEGKAKIFIRGPELPNHFGIQVETVQDEVSVDKLKEAIRNLSARNAERFSDEQRKAFAFVKRDRFSVKDKLKEILGRVKRETRVFFHELFPSFRCSKAERVTAFLGLLELLKTNQVSVRQEDSFAVILIENDEGKNDDGK